MTKFKVGDKVRYANKRKDHGNKYHSIDGQIDYDKPIAIGDVFVVSVATEAENALNKKESEYTLKNTAGFWFSDQELELVEKELYVAKIGGFGQVYKIIGQQSNGKYVMENSSGQVFLGQCLSDYKPKPSEPVVHEHWFFIYSDHGDVTFNDCFYDTEEEARNAYDDYFYGLENYKFLDVVKVEWKEKV